ncbi:hypothetical protein ABTL11_20425, partial [Acinetobacter baumannii]
MLKDRAVHLWHPFGCEAPAALASELRPDTIPKHHFPRGRAVSIGSNDQVVFGRFTVVEANLDIRIGLVDGI